MAKKMLMKDGMMEADLESDGESTSLSVENYPELEGVQVGETISGKWEGRIVEVKNGMVKVEYDSMELETENTADRDLRQMTKQESAPVEE